MRAGSRTLRRPGDQLLDSLGLRAAGLSGEDAERQVLRINPQAEPPADAGSSSDEGQAETIAAGNPFAALGGGSSDSGSESSDE